MLQRDDRGIDIPIIAPKAVVTTVAITAFRVNEYTLLLAETAFEFYINGYSANTMTRPIGVPFAVAESVETITTTLAITFAVQ